MKKHRGPYLQVRRSLVLLFFLSFGGSGRFGELLSLPDARWHGAPIHHRELCRLVTNPTTWNSISRRQVHLIVLAITFVLGFWIAYFWSFMFAICCRVGFSLSARCLLDLEHHPNDFVAPGARRRAHQPGLIGRASPSVGLAAFSDFAVIVAYVHLFTLFMIVPIFNSMARIDRSVVEAALDGGSSRWRIIWEIIIPLSKTGIALGSIFVITLVMGDFYVVNTMSGGHSASVVLAMYNQIAAVQYPWAAASAVVLLTIVTLMVAAILRLVDVRRELSR
jgi:putative spermidine/putrescine transport system permease protein